MYLAIIPRRVIPRRALGDKKTFSFGQYDRYEGNVEHFTGGSSEHCDGRSRRADVQVRPSRHGRLAAHGHAQRVRACMRVRADGHWQRRDEGALREGETEVRIDTLGAGGYGYSGYGQL